MCFLVRYFGPVHIFFLIFLFLVTINSEKSNSLLIATFTSLFRRQFNAGFHVNFSDRPFGSVRLSLVVITLHHYFFFTIKLMRLPLRIFHFLNYWILIQRRGSAVLNLSFAWIVSEIFRLIISLRLII